MKIHEVELRKAIAYNARHSAILNGRKPEIFVRFVAVFQREHKLTVDGMLGPITWARLLESWAKPQLAPQAVDITGNGVIDRRAFAKSNKWTHKDYPEKRTEQITGITLHQFADDYDGIERMNSANYHAVLLQDSDQLHRLWLYDWDRFVFHGNGWNARCVGFALDGRFPGIERWRRAHHNDISDAMAEAAIEMIGWMIKSINAAGGNVRALVSHRQSSSKRRGDPSEIAWRKVALPAMERYGLRDGGQDDHTFKIGDGRPNPGEWDPSRRGILF